MSHYCRWPFLQDDQLVLQLDKLKQLGAGIPALRSEVRPNSMKIRPLTKLISCEGLCLDILLLKLRPIDSSPSLRTVIFPEVF